MKKFVFVFVILFLAINKIYGSSEPQQEQRVLADNDKSIEKSENNLENSSSSTTSTTADGSIKSKRGIFGYAGGQHALTYEIPLGTAAYPYYGFKKPWYSFGKLAPPTFHTPNYASGFHQPNHHHHVQYPHVHANAAAFPPQSVVGHPYNNNHHHHHVHQNPQFLITPGSATVTSYNVNYPRHPTYYGLSNKPHVDIPIHIPAPQPSIVIAKPAVPLLPPQISPPPPPPHHHHHQHFVPAAAAFPSIVHVQKPIIPVAVSPSFINRIPTVVRPPTYHFIPSTGPSSSPPLDGVFPTAAVQPEFIPIPLPAQPHPVGTIFPLSTVPTFTSSTPTILETPSATIPSTDQWHPIFVSHQHPTQITPNSPLPSPSTPQRPSISLLPPYGSAPAGVSAAGDQQQQLELEQTFIDTNDFDQQQFHQQQQQQQPSQLYLSPTSASASSSSPSVAENIFDTSNQDFSQGNQHHHQQLRQQQQQQQRLQQQYHHQQQQQEYHRQQLIQEQQQIHSGGAFNGQAYEPASNNGRYSGPSSYEVQLGSYTRNI